MKWLCWCVVVVCLLVVFVVGGVLLFVWVNSDVVNCVFDWLLFLL